MKLNRRTFLKTASAGGVYCALAHAVPGTLASLYAAAPLRGKAGVVNSICEMCSTRCPISAKLVNDKNVHIGGNKNARPFGGSVCARGGAGHSLLYDPDRLVNPIKRVGKRGEGKWKEISWEEAYSEISKKLLEIKDKYGPETVTFSSKAGSQDGDLFYLANAYGSPNTFTHISTCPGGYVVAGKALFGRSVKRDIGNSKYIINFGHNIYEGINMSETRGMMFAQVDKGAKLVVFDPRFSIVADKADEWHAIKPGTDVTVALAICHVMIRDNLVDHDFINEFVNGYEEFSEEVSKYTPEWAEKISDVKATDIVRITHEIAAHAPHALVDFGHRSTFTTEEFELRRSLYAINILLGNLEREGGIFFGANASDYNNLAGDAIAPELVNPNNKLPSIDAERIDLADKQFTLIASSGGVYQSILDAVVEAKPYQLKAWIIARSNPVMTLTDRAKVEKAIKALELVVVCDVYISETASYADIVLPESTYLEREESIFDYYGKFPKYAIRQPVVETIGNTKPCWKIWRDLAFKLGLGDHYSWQDMESYQLAQLGGDQNELQKLKKEGWLEYGGVPLLMREKKTVTAFNKEHPNSRTPDSDGTYSSALKFGTPSGKIELSSPRVEEMAPGRGIIRYREVKLKADDELFFIQGKVAVHTNAATQNVPMLSNLMPDCGLWMHPETAGKLNIKTGDNIRIFNELGSEEGAALVTPGIRKDTVFAYMGFGSKNKELKRAYGHGIHCGHLLPDVTGSVAGMSLHTTGVKVEKV